MISKHCVMLMLGLSLLAGCAVSRLSPDDPQAAIPDRTPEILIGRMGRADVCNVLGVPRFSSPYWGFDLFRADTEQTEVMYAVTPWPIPFARIKDRLQRYTLVAYDTNGRVSAVDTGLFRRPAAWRNVSPISFDFPSLHLRAGDIMFLVDPEGAREVNLLVSPRRRDAFLQNARHSKECTAVLGCGGTGCSDQVSVDAGPVRRLPVRTAHSYWFKDDKRDSWLDGVEAHGSDASMPWLEALVAINLAAGEHSLAFSAKHLGGSSSLKVVCRPGEVTYVVISASSNKSFWNPALVAWQVNQSDAMPKSFARRPLVLLDDGQWYVDTSLSM